MGIDVIKLSFAYGKGPQVLKDISFHLDDGCFVCLLGPNGVGKSTLFKCMLGLLTHYKGSIMIDGEDISKLSPRQLARRAAYIPQSTAPVFNYTVSDVVLMGTTSLTSDFGTPGEKELSFVDKALDMLNIQYLKDRMFMNISGGERQLILIARALAQQTKVLFMDEPTANLDYGNQVRVLEQVKSLAKQGYTIIQSTHNPEQAFLYADQVIAVKNGAIAAHGRPKEVMDAQLIQDLYDVNVRIESLMEDRIRICIPEFADDEAVERNI